MKDIPKGWVRVSEYDERDDKNSGGPTGNYARILACIKAEPSPIRAYRDGKYWIACKEDIEDFLRESEQPAASKKCTGGQAWDDNRTEAAVIALCEINNGISLMQSTLERLTEAVEKIAKHPLARLEDVGILEHDALPG